MASNITYQYSWGFATYKKSTEASQIALIEAEGNYIDKFEVTITERELIDDSDVLVEAINGKLVLTRQAIQGEVL